MTPWVRRDPPGGASATHALVVGVSRYTNLPVDGEAPPVANETFGLRHAKTPATSAWVFARWLESTYNNPAAPIGTIRVLLSPSDWEIENVPELADLPVEIVAATRDNVDEAVAEWFADCRSSAENVAVLYAGGHGIQMGKDDGGIVLLEDFAKLPNVLDHSLDVGAVRKGMAGETIAQRQFYFVDACRVRPAPATRFETLGTGVGLPSPFEGAPRCSAVYFSATPSTEALGEPGKGTLFVQALLDCLGTSLGVDDHAQEDGTWAVTTATLMQALPKRVRELAEAFEMEQTATTGGQLQDVPFHVLAEPPDVPITLLLTPENAAACARAKLWIGATSVFDDEAFTPRLEKRVKAGKYILTVRIEPPTPPFKDIDAYPVIALPPHQTETISVA